MKYLFINIKTLLIALLLWAVAICIDAQELNAKISINHNQVQGTESAIFEELQEKLQEWINGQQWTALHFQENERISCNFHITVTEYKKEQGTWTCTCLVQANRPVYNSAYSSVLFQFQDKEFTFTYKQFDNLTYNEEMIDNQLTALFAYYAYLIIGMNLDSFSPMGGEDILQRCLNLTNNAQNLNYPGWASFDKNTNRFTIINDYLEGALQPIRQLQYDYYRKGLDEMANNSERGRTEITTALENDLKVAHENRPMSQLPQIWTDFKKDEIANIYKGKGTSKEKESVNALLFNINAAQNTAWSKILE